MSTPFRRPYLRLSLFVALTATLAITACAQPTSPLLNASSPVQTQNVSFAPAPVTLNLSPVQSVIAPVPGVVITHSPASSRVFIGSPSLAVLPNKTYLAKCDLFGPGADDEHSGTTRIFASKDRGRTWRFLSDVHDMYWATLFVYKGAAYLLGVTHEYGQVVIRRSRDNGHTWTEAKDARTGLLRADGKFHCAPVPVVLHGGRIWRAMEDAEGPGGWGSHFRAFMMSAPQDADLLNAANWTSSNPLARDPQWNGGDFGGWLEGNAVVTPQGDMVDMLRVDTHSADEKAALIHISADGKTATFDPQTGLVALPGGAKKFTIRFDPVSKLYWSLTNEVPPRHRQTTPGSVRNTLALIASPDLKTWQVRSIVLYHPDVAQHGFQYVDWLFDGNDLIFVARTAYDDGLGGANNYHDANFLTFHRLANFRRLTLADSVPMSAVALTRYETRDFILTGRNFELATLTKEAKAFSNRDYVWSEIPDAWRNGHFTRLGGGQTGEITVKAKRDALLTIATSLSLPGVNLQGWQMGTETLRYSDHDKTSVTLFTRNIKAGETVVIPQGNWTGSMVLLAAE